MSTLEIQRIDSDTPIQVLSTTIGWYMTSFPLRHLCDGENVKGWNENAVHQPYITCGTPDVSERYPLTRGSTEVLSWREIANYIRARTTSKPKRSFKNSQHAANSVLVPHRWNWNPLQCQLVRETSYLQKSIGAIQLFNDSTIKWRALVQ